MNDSAEHDGIFMSNFTSGRMGENGNAAFGKAAIGNDFWECIFSWIDASQSCKEADKLHNGEVLPSHQTHLNRVQPLYFP